MKRNGQLEFDWTWAERKQCIDDAQLPSGRAKDVIRKDGSVKEGSRVAASAMCSLLRAINDCLGNNCEAWPSQKRLAQVMKVSTKTVQRAAQALERMNLLIVEERACRSGTQNFYRIVWNDLRLLSNQTERAIANRPSDTLSRPSDILTGPSDTLSRASDIVSTELKTTIQERKQTTQRDAWVVVVSDLGVGNAEGAIDAAMRFGWSAAEIEERIEAWRRLPEGKRLPGTLFNWLSRRGSYNAAQRAQVVASPRPRKPVVDHDQFERQKAEAQQAWRTGPSIADELRLAKLQMAAI